MHFSPSPSSKISSLRNQFPRSAFHCFSVLGRKSNLQFNFPQLLLIFYCTDALMLEYYMFLLPSLWFAEQNTRFAREVIIIIAIIILN